MHTLLREQTELREIEVNLSGDYKAVRIMSESESEVRNEVVSDLNDLNTDWCQPEQIDQINNGKASRTGRTTSPDDHQAAHRSRIMPSDMSIVVQGSPDKLASTGSRQATPTALGRLLTPDETANFAKISN